jgi:hypothetical protein
MFYLVSVTETSGFELLDQRLNAGLEHEVVLRQLGHLLIDIHPGAEATSMSWEKSVLSSSRVGRWRGWVFLSGEPGALQERSKTSGRAGPWKGNRSPHIGDVAGDHLVASGPDVQGPLDQAHGLVKQLFPDLKLVHGKVPLAISMPRGFRKSGKPFAGDPLCTR